MKCLHDEKWLDFASQVAIKRRCQLETQLPDSYARILGTLVLSGQSRRTSRVFGNGDMVFRRRTLPFLLHKDGRLYQLSADISVAVSAAHQARSHPLCAKQNDDGGGR